MNRSYLRGKGETRFRLIEDYIRRGKERNTWTTDATIHTLKKANARCGTECQPIFSNGGLIAGTLSM